MSMYSVMIQARLVIMRDILIKDGDFVAFAAFDKGLTGFMPAHFFLDNIVVALGELVHPLFERVDIFLGSTCGQGQCHSKNHCR